MNSYDTNAYVMGQQAALCDERRDCERDIFFPPLLTPGARWEYPPSRVAGRFDSWWCLTWITHADETEIVLRSIVHSIARMNKHLV